MLSRKFLPPRTSPHPPSGEPFLTAGIWRKLGLVFGEGDPALQYSPRVWIGILAYSFLQLSSLHPGQTWGAAVECGEHRPSRRSWWMVSPSPAEFGIRS